MKLTDPQWKMLRAASQAENGRVQLWKSSDTRVANGLKEKGMGMIVYRDAANHFEIWVSGIVRHAQGRHGGEAAS